MAGDLTLRVFRAIDKDDKGDTDMTRDITYQGIDWEVEYDWDDDARTNMEIVSIKTKADVYDHLLESTLDGLFDALEESFE